MEKATNVTHIRDCFYSCITLSECLIHTSVPHAVQPVTTRFQVKDSHPSHTENKNTTYYNHYHHHHQAHNNNHDNPSIVNALQYIYLLLLLPLQQLPHSHNNNSFFSPTQATSVSFLVFNSFRLTIRRRQ